MATIRVGRLLRQRLPGEELEFGSLALMKALDLRGPLRVSALAAVLELDTSTVSRHVRSLEDRGLVERTGDPDDGRASRVAVSEHGRSCLRRGGDRRRALIGALIADWDDDDREALRRLLHKLSDDAISQEHA
jgi:DNA-binding MarR family transcriptional regulator